MKAILCTKYGPPEVLQMREVEKPEPKDNEVLVRIRATSVTAAGIAMRKGKPLFGRLFLGLTKPKISIPGTDMAGEVVSVGRDVSRFSLGDAVFAASDLGGGCYAEYICIPEDGVIEKKPASMSFEEASAIIDGATTALAFLRDHGKIQSGQKILINGASGSIGTAAVQLAKHFGAEVTGVCSTSNLGMVKGLGADHVIDYKKEDFTRKGNTYDIIFDTVGKASFQRSRSALSRNGRFLSPVLGLSILFAMLWSGMFGKKKLIFAATGLRKPEEKLRDMRFLRDLIEEGRLKSVIDRTYGLGEIVEAHRYVGQGHKKGNVVVVP